MPIMRSIQHRKQKVSTGKLFGKLLIKYIAQFPQFSNWIYSGSSEEQRSQCLTKYTVSYPTRYRQRKDKRKRSPSNDQNTPLLT